MDLGGRCQRQVGQWRRDLGCLGMHLERGVVLLMQLCDVAAGLRSKHSECGMLLGGSCCLVRCQVVLVCGCLPVQQVQRRSDRDHWQVRVGRGSSSGRRSSW